MKCPNCGHENVDEARFCNECGTPLGQETVDDRFSILADYIPSELKKKMLQAGKQLESERRFVTVVFADASGFTPLSEKLDPEIVTSVMNDFFRGMISIILKYEGMIIDFFGDGILCIFGAPLAHENDPERAIRSSLEMMQYAERFNKITPHQLPAPMGLHVGINSGTVVTGNVGSDLRMRYSAVGSAVNLCSRIADKAPEGEIHISQDTQRLISSIADTDGPHSIKVKGKEEPLVVYRLLSMNAEVDSAAPKALGGFVGRREERERISQTLDKVLEKKEQRLFVRG